MREFLRDMLIEPFTDGDWIGYVLGGIVWFITIVIVSGLLWLSGWLIDSSFLPIKEKNGIVTEKHYVPAHTTTTFVMSGKVMIPIINYIDDSYDIIVEINGLTDNVSLYQNDWNEINIGDENQTVSSKD